MTDLTPAFEAIFTLASALAVAFLVPWLKNKIGAQHMDEFLKWVNIGVAAAEQIYETTDGDAKKAYVIQFLANKGFKVDTEALDNAIEAAVLQLHNALYGPVLALDGVEVTEHGN